MQIIKLLLINQLFMNMLNILINYLIVNILCVHSIFYKFILYPIFKIKNYKKIFLMKKLGSFYIIVAIQIILFLLSFMRSKILNTTLNVSVTSLYIIIFALN